MINILTMTSKINTIEKKLDSQVSKYDFSDKHPMCGITRRDTDNVYVVNHKCARINIKKLNNACERIKSIIQIYDIKNNTEILENVTKSSFTYNGRQFVTYWNNANPLFDIQTKK